MPDTADLPPSALYAYDKLQNHGELTHQDLVDATGMPPRTVTDAIDRLLEHDLVDRQISCRDARRVIYSPKTIN